MGVDQPSAGQSMPRSSSPIPPARIDSLRRVGRAAIVGVIVNIVLLLPDIVLTPMMVSAPSDERISTVYFWLVLGQLAVLVATGVAFIRWQHVGMSNLKTWRIQGLKWTPGWAVAGWFIPIANLLLPALVTRDLVRGSRTPPDQRERGRGGTFLVWAWWLTFLWANVAENALAGKDFTGQTVSYAAGYAAAEVLPYIISGALAIALIRRVNELQARRQAALDRIGWQMS